MDTLTAIKTRMAVREWDDRTISDEILNQILEMGGFAPSPLNSQPWHFIVLKNKTTIDNLMKTAKHGNFATQAPIVIVATAMSAESCDKWLYEHEPNIYNFSTVCAMANMWLALGDLGLAGCWVTLDKEVARSMLSIPSTHFIVGSIALGYSKNMEGFPAPKNRKKIEEVVSFDTF